MAQDQLRSRKEEGTVAEGEPSAYMSEPPMTCSLPAPGIDLAMIQFIRLLSWLESILSGTHPRTKGTRCFTGEYRQ